MFLMGWNGQKSKMGPCNLFLHLEGVLLLFTAWERSWVQRITSEDPALRASAPAAVFADPKGPDSSPQAKMSYSI